MTQIPVSVIVPVRNRSGQRMEFLVQSIVQQTHRPVELLISDFGSDRKHGRSIQRICEAAPSWVQHLRFSNAVGKPWNKCKANNLALRRTSDESRYILFMDADMIYRSDFLAAAVAAQDQFNDRAFVICRSRPLNRNWNTPQRFKPENVARDFPLIFEKSTKWSSTGANGACQMATRQWWFEVQGYDERMSGWGAMDGDMLNRAVRSGLEKVWIHEWEYKPGYIPDGNYNPDKLLELNEEVKAAVTTRMAHQWHKVQKSLNADSWHRNHRLKRDKGYVRNDPKTWGTTV